MSISTCRSSQGRWRSAHNTESRAIQTAKLIWSFISCYSQGRTISVHFFANLSGSQQIENTTCSFLTQVDVLAFKIEVFQNHNNLASNRCRICPPTHLTALNVISDDVKTQFEHYNKHYIHAGVISFIRCSATMGTWH